MLVRNNMLLELLHKANIPVPAFVGPKVFDYVVTQQENIQPDNKIDEKKGKLLVSKETLRKRKAQSDELHQKRSGKVNSDRLPKQGTAKTSESIEAVADGGVLSTTPATTTAATTTALLAPIITTGILVPLGSHQPPVKRTNAGKRIIRIRSRLSNPIAGKVAIPALKNNVCYKTQWKRNRPSKKKIPLAPKKLNKTDSSVKQTNSQSTGTVALKRANNLTIQGSDSNKRLKHSTNESLTIQCECVAEDRSSQDNKRANVDNANSSVPVTSELPNDLLASLQVPQHDSHESLSPTAAFLMSFPVVSAVSGGRMIDGENTVDTNTPHLLQLDELSAKHQHSDNNLLDNITSLFTTKDYDRFVEDVAKNGSGVRPSEEFFDFQLKPITNPRKLTVSVSTSLFTPDIPAPIYHNLSGYSTAPLVPLQPPSVMSSTLFPTLTDLSSSGPSFDFLNKNAGIRLNNDCLADNFTFSLTSTTTTLPTSSACALATDCAEKSYGFYDSLSTIGASYAPTMTITKSNQPAQLTSSTIYTSALSLSSSSANRKPPGSTNYTQHTPFTFSLSATTGMKPSLRSATTLPKHMTVTTSSSVHNSQQASQHNTYNPFAFDNIPSIPTVRESVVQPQFTFSLTTQTNTMPLDSKLPNYHHHQQSNARIQPQFTFSLTSQCSTHPIDTQSKSHNPQQQTSSTLNPFSIDYNILPDVRPRMSAQLPFRLSGPVPPPPLNHKMYATGGGEANQSHSLPKPNKSSNPRQSINWMTGTSSTEDFQYPMPSRTEMFFPPTVDETFTWSPNKLLDTSMNINSATLPNLHGDLALNTFAMKPISALQKIDKSQKSLDTFLTPLAMPLPTTPPPPSANFFSVSNLVENTRRNKVTTVDHKSQSIENRSKITSSAPNIFIESFASYSTATEPKQQISTTYSAEALLSGSNGCPAASNTSKKDKLPFLNNPTDFYSAQAACVESAFPNFDYSCDPSGNNYNFYNSNYLSQNYLENDYLGAASVDGKQRPMHFPFTSPTKQQQCQLSATDTIKELMPPIPVPSQVRPNDSHKKYKHDVFSMQQYDPTLAGNYFSVGLSNSTPSTVEDYYTANNAVPTVSSASLSNVSGNKQQSIGGSGSGNLVSNFNLSTICPEINEKIRQNNW